MDLVEAAEKAVSERGLRALHYARGAGKAQEVSAGPRSLTRIIRLCEILSITPSGKTLSELGLALATPKSTLLNSLRPLVQSDFLTLEGGLYRLGPGAFCLAANITASWSLPRLVSPYMRDLAAQTGESVGLAVPDWTTGRAVYINTIQSQRPVLYAMKAGQSAPFYASAAGRVLLANAAPATWGRFIADKLLKKLTSRTTTDPAIIREELAMARRQGYWLSVGQLLEDTATIAAPVFDMTGAAVAALSIGAPADRLLEQIDVTRTALLEMTGRVSAGFMASHSS